MISDRDESSTPSARLSPLHEARMARAEQWNGARTVTLLGASSMSVAGTSKADRGISSESDTHTEHAQHAKTRVSTTASRQLPSLLQPQIAEAEKWKDASTMTSLNSNPTADIKALNPSASTWKPTTPSNPAPSNQSNPSNVFQTAQTGKWTDARTITSLSTNSKKAVKTTNPAYALGSSRYAATASTPNTTPNSTNLPNIHHNPTAKASQASHAEHLTPSGLTNTSQPNTHTQTPHLKSMHTTPLNDKSTHTDTSTTNPNHPPPPLNTPTSDTTPLPALHPHSTRAEIHAHVMQRFRARLNPSDDSGDMTSTQLSGLPFFAPVGSDNGVSSSRNRNREVRLSAVGDDDDWRGKVEEVGRGGTGELGGRGKDKETGDDAYGTM